MQVILFRGFTFGFFLKNGCFSGRLRPDWGNTARVATARFGTIGLY